MMTFERNLRKVAVTASLPAALLALVVAVAPAAAASRCVARAAASPTAAPSSNAPEPGGAAAPEPASTSAPAAASRTPEPEPPLYTIGDQIYTIDHDATAFYYFQGNRDGSGKAKYELRYDRNLWDSCAQLQVRLPLITKWPTSPNASSPNANPYSGLGNAELRYSYNVVGSSFDHSLEGGFTMPTETNGVDSNDWQVKAFYSIKRKWPGFSVAYSNEFDQTLIQPPGASYTSYYEGKLTLPNYAFVNVLRGLKVSGIYNYRVLFDSTPTFKSAAGGIINGNLNDVALNLIGTWGLGLNGLWKYKLEASAVARF
jgi:hypothetical protein